MLFTYEMKKIWRRVSPLLVLILLALTAIATMVITAIFFNKTPDTIPDVSAQYAALQNKINHWDETVDRNAFATTFDRFYHDYKEMNASTEFDHNNLVNKYNTAKASFQDFYIQYYQNPAYGIKDNVNEYLLINTKYHDKFNAILTELNSFFNLISPTNDTIVDGLENTNSAWEDATLKDVLDNLFFVQKINATDLTVLRNFFVKYPAQSGAEYTNDAYDYALNRFWLAITDASTYTGDLSQYTGFNDYQNTTTSTRACITANYCLEHAGEDFATPFEFGNIFNNSNQVSLFDFVFTNLEMAMLPLTLLVMIWAACIFFTDNNQNTLITPVIAGKRRSSIILTKMAVVLILTTVSLLLLSSIYIISGLLFFKAYLSPDILFLFNGTQAMTMSAANYFILYFLNLVFKLLPLIAVCGLFSFTKTKPFVIVGFTTLIYAAILAANFLLGSFSFYKYVPLMGLDPIRYFGAELMFAPMPITYNIWYTFPAMFVITAGLYWALIHLFRHHDF